MSTGRRTFRSVDLSALLTDEEYREALASESYYRERADEAAADREHEISGDVAYFALSWESISDYAKRPYRTSVAHAFDHLLSVLTTAEA